jgi:two-component system, cell cycle sensor histidine kinase and response regulator CckA
MEGRYTYVNPAWEATFGYRPDEMLGRRFTEFQTPEMAQRDLEAFGRLLSSDLIKSYETVHLGKNGSEIYLVFNARFIRDSAGKIIGLRGVAHDITERKKMELLLRESEETLSAVFTESSTALAIVTPAGTFSEVNQAFCSLLGCSMDEIVDKIVDVSGLKIPVAYLKDIDEGLKNRIIARNIEVTFTTPDGVTRSVMYSVDPITIRSARYLLVTATDITERSLAETRLKERESLYSALFTSSPMLMAMSRLSDSRIVKVNPLFCTTLGYSREELLDRTSTEIGVVYNPEDREKALLQLKKAGSLNGFEMQLRKKDGTLIPVLASAEIVEIENENCVLTSAIDISERKKAEEELKRNEFLLRTALENLPIIFYMIDRGGIFRLSIGAGLKGLGLEQNQVVGLSAFEIYKDFPEIKSSIRKALAGKRTTFETTLFENSYFSVCIPAKGWFDGLVAVALDITERKRSEEVLHNVQKLEALGVLAGGIAHDFNNLLGGIFGYIDLALSGTREEDTKKYLNAVLPTLDRVKGLTHQLLTFSKGGMPIRMVIPVGEFIRDSVNLRSADQR